MYEKVFFILPVIVCLYTSAIHARPYPDSLSTGEARKRRFLISAGAGFIEGAGVNINVEYGLLGNRKTGALMAGLFGSGMWYSRSLREFHGGAPDADIDETYYAAGIRATYRYELLHRLEIYVTLWTGMLCQKGYAVGFDHRSGYWEGSVYYSSGGRSNRYEKYPFYEYLWQGGGYLGFRYHFSNAVGLYVEGGYGISIINAGFAFSF
jgi:hypothetical protein